MPSGRRRGTGRSCTIALTAVVLACALGAARAIGDDTDASEARPLGLADGGAGDGAAGGARGYTGGVVTAAHPIAAQAGIDALAAGGNAIDAAAVVQFVLNVVEPTSSGIGGGGFMGIHLPDEGRTFFIDSRERAPGRATPTQFLACDPDCGDEDFAAEGGPARIGPGFTDIATSGIGVGVPGTLLGVARALDAHGSWTLAEALAPAIALAEGGFPINARLATLTENPRTTFWEATASTFRTPDGEPLSEGFVLVQPDLAKTFRLIAEEGVDAFYFGPLARAIVAAQRVARETVGERGRGRMTIEDLADYRLAGVDEREPIVSDYRGYTIMGMPPPSSGGLTVTQILECLERFPLGDAEAGFGPGSARTLHVMLESMRLAFSSRSVWIGDTDLTELPVAGLQSADYLAPRCELMAAETRLDEAAIEPGDPRRFDPAFAGAPDATVNTAADGPGGVDTTHFSIIDEAGTVVSWTSTIEGTWGSGITVPGYGFLLNNELTDFNFVPQATAEATAAAGANGEAGFAPGANDVAPFKRPRSSMAPTLVFGGDDFLAAYGSPGGSTIINTVVNVTVNLIDHGMPVQAAIDAPRISTSGGSVAYEAGFDEAALERLRELGHALRDEPGEIGSVQAVIADPASGSRHGGADDRRAGAVRGSMATR